MVLWRVYQLLLACVGACGMVWLSKSLDQEPNGYLVGLVGIGVAWLGTMIIFWIADLRHYLRRWRLRRSASGASAPPRA